MNRLFLLLLRILRSLPQGLLGMLRNLETLMTYIQDRPKKGYEKSPVSFCDALWKKQRATLRVEQAVKNEVLAAQNTEEAFVVVASHLVTDPSPYSLSEDEEDNPLILSLFLNLILKDIQNDPSALVPYTEEMSAEDDELLAGVVIDS